MRLRTTLLAFAVAASLSACGDKDKPDTTAATPTPAADPGAAPVLPPPPPARIRGQAVMGKDGYGVTVCGDTQQKIITIAPEAQPVLDKFLAGGAKEFFLDGWGTTDEQGATKIIALERVYTEGPGCDEKDISLSLFRARGNEPGWSVDVQPSGVIIQRPGAEPVTAEYQPLEKLDAGVRRFVNEMPNGKVEFTLTPGICSDGMSDTVYGWTASLKVGDEAMAGCGFSGLVSE
jgi:uncharacterized membrane protein